MSIDVTMPKLSDTMEEGKIIRWVKHPGDKVVPGDVLAEVETDKANMELEAYDEGVLRELRIGEGQSAPVGAVIAVLGGAGEQAAAAPGDAQAPAAPPVAGSGSRPPAARRPEPARETAAPGERRGDGEEVRDDRRSEPRRPVAVRREPPPAEGERLRASPLARRMAEEQGVDLQALTGTGPGGRIVERDVESALAARGGGEARPAEASRAPVTLRTEAQPIAGAAGKVELSRIRRTTAKRMAEAKREVPHFYVSAEIAMDEAVRVKEGLTALGDKWKGLTYTHLVLKAVGVALPRVPELNASYDGDGIALHDTVNIGLATAVDDGLVVPVVRGCDRTPLVEIVRQVKGLVERARAGRFASDDLTGGTFTVSNLGMFPVSEFAAIINPPQAGILAVSAIREVPVVRAGGIAPGRVMTVTLSVDHRIIDGVLAGRFLRELKSLLEQPLTLVG